MKMVMGLMIALSIAVSASAGEKSTSKGYVETKSGTRQIVITTTTTKEAPRFTYGTGEMWQKLGEIEK